MPPPPSPPQNDLYANDEPEDADEDCPSTHPSPTSGRREKASASWFSNRVEMDLTKCYREYSIFSERKFKDYKDTEVKKGSLRRKQPAYFLPLHVSISYIFLKLLLFHLDCDSIELQFNYFRIQFSTHQLHVHVGVGMMYRLHKIFIVLCMERNLFKINLFIIYLYTFFDNFI